VEIQVSEKQITDQKETAIQFSFVFDSWCVNAWSLYGQMPFFRLDAFSSTCGGLSAWLHFARQL